MLTKNTFKNKLTVLVLLALYLPAFAGDKTANSSSETKAAQEMFIMAASLPSADLDKSIAFYKTLGLTLEGKIEMGRVTEAPMILPGGNTRLMLLHPKDENQQIAPRDTLSRLVIQVPDIKAVKRNITDAGYSLDTEMDLPKYNVSIAILKDPDGNHLELVQRN